MMTDLRFSVFLYAQSYVLERHTHTYTQTFTYTQVSSRPGEGIRYPGAWVKVSCAIPGMNVW